MTHSKSKIAAILRAFEKWAREDEVKGCQHPDLRDWIQESYIVARKRAVAALADEDVRQLKMPRKPSVDY